MTVNYKHLLLDILSLITIYQPIETFVMLDILISKRVGTTI